MRKPNILVGIQFILFALMLIVVLIIPTEPDNFQVVIGLATMFFGSLIGLVAIFHHPGGPKMSPEPKRSGQLIQTGLYRWIRHPIYTGVLLGALGLAVYHGHPASFAIFAVFVVFFTYKSHYEETLLQSEFTDYVTYMQNTGRFIPPLRSQRPRA